MKSTGRYLPFLSALLFLFIGTSLFPTSAEADSHIPKPFCLRGHVFDSLGVPHEGADVYNFEATTTDEDGSWEICSEVPLAESETASKTVNGRPALQARVSDWLVTAPEAYYDFYLPFVMETPRVFPRYVTSSQAVSIELSVLSYAPASTLMSAQVRNHDIRSEMAFDSTDSDGFSTWDAELTIPQGMAEGFYLVSASGHSDSGSLITDCAYWCYGWFGVDNTAPEIELVEDLWVTADATVATVPLADSISGVDASSVSVLIEGTEVASDYDPKSRRLTFPVTNTDPEQMLQIQARDIAGNLSEAQGYLRIDHSPPTVMSPTPVGVTPEHSPLLGVNIDEVGSGIDISSLRMFLNGNLRSSHVRAVFDRVASSFTYQIPTVPTGLELGEAPLIDGEYQVVVEGRDVAGNSFTYSWGFRVSSIG